MIRIENLTKIYKSKAKTLCHALDGIAVIPKLLTLDAMAIVAISFVSALLPTLLLKRIKPVEIIKAKE